MMVRYLVTGGVLLVVLAGFFFLPVEVPHGVTVQGRLLPVREWMLVRDADGNLEARLRDHAHGRVDELSVNRFARGEAVRVVLHRGHGAATVAVGDTVASIYSTAVAQEQARLAGALSEARARLDFFAAGEKAAVVREAEGGVAAAEERVRQQQKEVERLRPLRSRGLASAQEYELSESLLRVLEADAGVARAHLEAVRTGERPQQLDLTRAEAEAVRAELEAVGSRLETFTVTTPLGGVALRSYGSDTLLTVRDTSAFVVVMPVAWQDHRRLAPQQPVEVRVEGYDRPVRGRIVGVGDQVHVVLGEQVLLVTALVDPAPAGLLPGVVGRCTISLGRRSLPDYARMVAREWFL